MHLLATPSRLKGRLTGQRTTEFGPFNLADGWRLDDRKGRPTPLRAIARAVTRSVLIAGWSLIAIPVQAILLLLPGPPANHPPTNHPPTNHPKVRFARFYWKVIAWLLGIEVRVIGTPASGCGRPVMFVSNHSSWLDIPVLGGQLPAVFVAKRDVDGWPVVGTIARLGRTVFVSRHRLATARERDDMRERLTRGDNLILFPEGTSSDGSRVLPFRSSFFAIAQADPPPLIQPVSLVFDRLSFLPIGRANRPLFAWYGDMEMAPHFWRIVQQTGCRATLLLHPPVDPRDCASRKDLARLTWVAVADGAALLRQNRPAPGNHLSESVKP